MSSELSQALGAAVIGAVIALLGYIAKRLHGVNKAVNNVPKGTPNLVGRVDALGDELRSFAASTDSRLGVMQEAQRQTGELVTLLLKRQLEDRGPT